MDGRIRRPYFSYILLAISALWLCLFSVFPPQVDLRKQRAKFSRGNELEPPNEVTGILPRLNQGVEDYEAAEDNFIDIDTNVTAETLSLDDIFISVKTSGKFHRTRIAVILKTWWTAAKNQAYLFTDVDDELLLNQTDGHLVNTRCHSSHFRKDLACKMGAEYDAYMNTNNKWWCHFDDDNYVNVVKLVELLKKYSWKDKIYLGKKSLSHPLKINYGQKLWQFWFATGGAGLCISRGLAIEMEPWSRNGRFMENSEATKLPDDCTLGFIINGLLKVDLVPAGNLHSHLEELSTIPPEEIGNQVTLSYHIRGEEEEYIATFDKLKKFPVTKDSGRKRNVVRFGKLKQFSIAEDPSRFLSIHCLLYPAITWCENRAMLTTFVP